MHMSRLFVMSCLLGSALVACGDDGGKTGGNVDAPKQIDAAIDAPGGGNAPTGLGKKCTQPTDCPASASECIGLAMGTNSYCTPKCVTGGTGMTNAMGSLPLNAVNPPPNNAACTSAFTGTTVVGTPACVVILSTTPADNPLMANKQYTQIELGCVVVCGTGNTCPMGMTAKTLGSACACLPN